MVRSNFRSVSAVLAIGLAGLAPSVSHGQAADVKTAEQVYKNITQLKGTPADQLPAAMQFISASLGVECSFCHVEGKPEADDKRAKQTARSMIAMQMAINKESFNGRPQVTCYSCHRGATNPVAVPTVMATEGEMKPPTAAGAPRGGGAPQVTADQILEKYIAAVGGADAVNKINTRISKGVIQVAGNETQTEILQKAPNKRLSISHQGNSDSFTAYDGTGGWMGTAARNRDMSATDAASYEIDAELHFPTRIKEIFPQLRPGRPETVNGTDCNVLNGSTAARMQVRMYFAKDSGLLVRLVRYTDTPLGRMPVQIDYSDYRDADGVKIPFKWTLARPAGRFTTQLKEVQSNVPIDDSKFAKPAK